MEKSNAMGIEVGKNQVALIGADGSPYSVKIRAVLRYRRISHVWVPQFQLGPDMFEQHFPNLRAKVIPVLVWPDGRYENDSTPLILELERKYHHRKIVPETPMMAFLSAVLEDFSDEWMTKVMFEGRFHEQEFAKFGAGWQIRQAANLPDDIAVEMVNYFATRQVKRRSLVGCENWPAMEKTLRKICEILEANSSKGNPFIFGHQPTNADFALYGQLRQLATDPFPSIVMHQYPGAWGWVFRMDDLSGLNAPDISWQESSEVPFAAKEMLELVAETYLPFLIENERAIKNGDKSLSIKIFGGKMNHEQPPFKYQVRCLQILREQFQQLSSVEKGKVEQVLPGAIAAFSPPAKL